MMPNLHKINTYSHRLGEFGICKSYQPDGKKGNRFLYPLGLENRWLVSGRETWPDLGRLCQAYVQDGVENSTDDSAWTPLQRLFLSFRPFPHPTRR